MDIVAQIEDETKEKIEGGCWTEYPDEGYVFLKTNVGYLSSEELVIALYRIYGDKPFVIRHFPYEGEEVQISSFHSARMRDLVHGDF